MKIGVTRLDGSSHKTKRNLGLVAGAKRKDKGKGKGGQNPPPLGPTGLSPPLTPPRGLTKLFLIAAESHVL